MDLRLRPFRSKDEAQALAAQSELGRDDFVFLLEYSGEEPWERYLGRLDQFRSRAGVPPGMVPATMLAAEAGGELVGRVSIRHELNDNLRRAGGHIGYGVRPRHRRRGYATEILRQSLIVARSLGVDAVLVTCDEDNVGSRAVIERCGGLLQDVVNLPGGRMCHYWIA